ncbi:WXG100 family type VII secretion target [Mycolicibacterium fortuitum]|uniref:WXG100 family type VII secretion target n=1 Tax=Mycolicibacterium fortuitum TaxID=1766 RepID=UPI0009436913|nr:WXG100 family type VII secretion target [Mycolicibacterium fortuitum]
MPKPLRVDPEALHRASNRMLDHMDTSRREHSDHDDDLVDAAAKWNGDIADALTHVANTWAEKRAALHTSVGKIGNAMADAAVDYVTTEQNATDNIKHTGDSL